MEEKKYSLLSWLHLVAHPSARPCWSVLHPASPPARVDAPWAWAKPGFPHRHLRWVGKIPQPPSYTALTCHGSGRGTPLNPHPPASPRPFHHNLCIKGQIVAGTSAAAGSLAGGAGAEMGAGAERGCRWVQEQSVGCRWVRLSPCKFTHGQARAAPSTSGHRLQTPGSGGSFHAAQQMSSEA